MIQTVAHLVALVLVGFHFIDNDNTNIREE